MATKSVTLRPPKRQEHPCPCGCAPCEATGCQLDCLIQPRFFCGQLLTDTDLTALLTWTQDKLRLGRFRHGWGVVCGLDVRRDPDRPGHIIVAPGYAVSCCGDDIVVCEETAVDLSQTCLSEGDGCAAPTHTAPKSVVFDLFIHYHEELASPVASLGRGVCREATNCEYSRTRESFRLIPRRVDEEVKDSQFSFVQAWGEQYKDWLAQHLPRPTDSIESWYNLVEQAQRNPFLDGCFRCHTDHGVPLARIWLKTHASNTSTSCTVIALDPYPPYRRPLQSESWPALPRTINLAQFLWHRLDEFNQDVLARLEEFDLDLRLENIDGLDGVRERVLKSCIFLPHKLPDKDKVLLTVLLARLDVLGWRIVGFESADCVLRNVDDPQQAPNITPPIREKGDDLEKIPNIGKQRQTKLHQQGISTFEQLAEMGSTELSKFLGIAEDDAQDIIQDASNLAQEGAKHDA